MAIVSKKFLICDRCGESIEATDTIAGLEISTQYPGWVRVSKERLLCPKCSPDYETLIARHKVEEEDYITGSKEGA